MAVFPKKMGFCAIEASQTAWQESGAGEVLGRGAVEEGHLRQGALPVAEQQSLAFVPR